MSDDPFVDENQAQQKVNEFIEQHGTEGLFVLYFRQFIYRFIKQELKSADEEVEDIGTQLHLDQDGDDILKNRREEMKEQCEYWARDLVDHLKKDEVVSEVIESGDLGRLEEEKVEERVKKGLDEKFDEWEEQLEEFLEDVE
ncbi:hypothetical protein [Halostella pelagica]|uniref:hypothetical protein n=1 Tax=Halostella pelagica TaxID=2583824 RepID=UPI00108008B9|nr:hypothetical protein [Halostella pelagica]